MCTRIDGGLGVVELEDAVHAVTGDAERPIARFDPDNAEIEPAGGILVPHGEKWFYMHNPVSGRKITVNGDMTLGLLRVRHRDELRVRGTKLHMLDESPARVRPFPGAKDRVDCPRCTTKIKPGHPAVRCPNPQCRQWHHQFEEPIGDEAPKPCWTYGKRCASATCNHPTTLDGSFSWLPED